MANINTQKLIPTLSALADQTENTIKKLPTGTLYAQMKNHKHPQYYIALKNSGSGSDRKYLHTSERHLATQLAQREYSEKFLKELNKQLSALKQVENAYNPDTLKQIYATLPPAKKLLVTPYILPDEEFVQHWYETCPGNQNPYVFQDTYQTERGETVRSKSEKIIADKLFYKQIPYSYEAALSLNQKGIIYPDFTILNQRTRKTYYYEHFGMMDNPEYCKHALEKITLYQKNGFWAGDTFLFTMESSQKPIDMQMLDQMIKQYFL